MITLTGKKVAEGIAVGRLTFYKRGKKEIRRIYVEDAKKEVLRFKKACEKAVKYADDCRKQLEEAMNAEAVYQEKLNDLLACDWSYL